MLYFPCPKCGGKVVSAENDFVSHANRNLKRFAGGGMTGHAHPLLGMVASAIAIGNFVYQRCPGGGAKRCTNPRCNHRFN
jgi:hypothetical protein